MQLQKRTNNNNIYYTLLIENGVDLNMYTRTMEELSHYFIIDIWDIMVECSNDGVLDGDKFMGLFKMKKPKISMLAELLLYKLDKKPSIKIRGGVIEFTDLANIIHSLRNLKHTTILKYIMDNKKVVVDVYTGGFYVIEGVEKDGGIIDYVNIEQGEKGKLLTTILGSNNEYDTSFNFDKIKSGIDINKRILILENSNKIGNDDNILSTFENITSEMLKNEVQTITNLETRLRHYTGRDIYKIFYNAIKNDTLDTIYFSTLTIETEQFEFLSKILNEIMIELSNKKLYICAIINEGKKLSENKYSPNIIIMEDKIGD